MVVVCVTDSQRHAMMIKRPGPEGGGAQFEGTARSRGAFAKCQGEPARALFAAARAFLWPNGGQPWETGGASRTGHRE